MGRRGPGAGRQRLARDQAEAAPKRRLPWKRKGLTRAQRVIAFLEFLPVTKGALRGKRMKLLPDQREFIERTFATDKRGRRKVSLAILSEPKGNGKTGLVSGICLCFLVGPEAEERGEIYSASITKAKAAIIFNEMRAIIQRVPEFAGRCNIIDFHKRIHVYGEGDGYDSTYESLSSDSKTAQGLSPTAWAFDELGESDDGGALLSVLMESAGKRDETLGIVLSTQAPDDEHPLSKLIDDALSGADKSVYLQLHAAPSDADPFSDETIKAANPAWGKFLDLEAVKKSRDRARRIPAFESAYRRLRLNQRVDAQSETRLVPLTIWKKGSVPVDRIALAKRCAFGGLDLSKKSDLSALVLAFPDDDPDPNYDVLCWCWTPFDAIEARKPQEQKLFRQWIKDGFLIGVPGATIRFSFIAKEMARLATEFDIRGVAFDRWKIDDFLQDLAEEDCSVALEPRGQGFKDQGADVEITSELLLNGKVRHAGHPVLTAALAGAVMESDPAGNLKITKQKQRGPVRVDPLAALVMALGLASRGVDAPPPKPSVGEWLARGPIMVGV